MEDRQRTAQVTSIAVDRESWRAATRLSRRFGQQLPRSGCDRRQAQAVPQHELQVNSIPSSMNSDIWRSGIPRCIRARACRKNSSLIPAAETRHLEDFPSGGRPGSMVQLLLKGTFWLGAATVAYVYLLYPVLIWALAGVRRERREQAGAQPTTAAFSVVLAVHDEAARISSRLDELLAQIGTTGQAEVVVVTDGCTDATAA